MKRLASIALALALLAGALPLGAFAAPKPITKVTVEYNAHGPVYMVAYEKQHQIERIMDLLPTKDQAIQRDPLNVETGGWPVEVKIYRGGSDPAEVWYIHGSYAIDMTEGAGTKDYSMTHEKHFLLRQLTGYNQDTYDGPVTYQGEKITGLYVLDGETHTYNPAHSYLLEEMEPVIQILEKTPQTKNQVSKTGFLLTTQKGRYAWYYNNLKDETLRKFTEQERDQRMQWLVYMNPDKIESITFMGSGGRDFTLGAADKYLTLSLDTKDRDSIDKIAAYLKSMPVKGAATVLDDSLNFNMSYSVYMMGITFHNGVVYTIGGYSQGMHVITSDLNRTMSYTIPEDQIKALRDFISLLPDTVVKVTDPAA